MWRWWIVVTALALAGCSEREVFAPESVDVLVVDAVLVVDEPLPPVFLSRTVAPDRPLEPGSAAESGATVRIRVDGTAEVTYTEDLFVPGRYVPLGPPAIVTERTLYALEVESSRGEHLRAVTSTPARLDVTEWLLLDDDAFTLRRALRTYEELGDSVYSVAENQVVYADGILEARFEAPDPAVIPALQVALFSLDPESDFVIDPDFFEDEDFEELDRANYSPMFSGADGFLRLPWFSIFFEGRYQIKVYAADRNWTDYVRSAPALAQSVGFGRNAGETFEKPIFHVEGGIGLFASASVDSIGFAVRPGAN